MPGLMLLHIDLLLPVYTEAAPLRASVQRIAAGMSYLVNPAQAKAASNSVIRSIYRGGGQVINAGSVDLQQLNSYQLEVTRQVKNGLGQNRPAAG
jgi:hypothetical protein